MGVHTHSMAFMHTQWVFRGCSHSLIDIHAHSMGVQGVFNTHSKVFTCTHKHSGGVLDTNEIFLIRGALVKMPKNKFLPILTKLGDLVGIALIEMQSWGHRLATGIVTEIESPVWANMHLF